MKTAREMLEVRNTMDIHFYGQSTGNVFRTTQELEAFGINISDVWSDLDEVLKRHAAKAASKEVK